MKFLYYTLYFYLAVYLAFRVAYLGVQYYILKETIPLMIFAIAHFWNVNLRFKKPCQITMIALIVLMVVFGSTVQGEVIFGLRWRWYVYAEYLLFTILYFELFTRKLRTHLEAFAYTLILLPVVGFIWEIPWFLHHNVEFLSQFMSQWFPFYVRSNILALFLICYKVGLKTFIKPVVLLSFVLLNVFNVVLFFNKDLNAWLVRLPTLLFWLIVVYYAKPKQPLTETYP